MKRVLAIISLLCLTALGQDADFRRQVQTTDITRQLLQKRTAQQIRDLLNVSDVGSELTVKTNLAALAAHSGATNLQVITVLGRSTIGDWGEPKLWYLDTSSTATNEIAITNAGGSGCWLLAWDGNASAFGVATNSNDNAPAINAALEVAKEYGIKTVRMPAGLFQISTSIVLQAKTWLKGEPVFPADSDSLFTTSLRFSEAGHTRISLATNANCPMIVLAPTNGLYARQTAESQEDGSISESYTYSCGVENIMLNGNGSNQTRYDCHGIKLEGAWYVTLRNVGVYYTRGHRLWARDCNMLIIDGYYGSGSGTVNGTNITHFSKGALIYGCGDIQIRNCFEGFNGGPSFWITGSSSWQNTLSESMLYNNMPQKWTVASVNTSSGTLNVSTNHTYETGMLAELITDGSPPSGIATNRPYWTIKISATELAFATTLSNALAGVAVVPTTTGSGTHYVWHGPGSSLYFSWGANLWNVSGSRFDQNFDDGVYIHNGTAISFTGNNSTFNGHNTMAGLPSGVTAAGFLVEGPSSGIVFDGNIVGSLSPNYPQAYAVYIKGAAATAAALPVRIGSIGSNSATVTNKVDALSTAVRYTSVYNPLSESPIISSNGIVYLGNSTLQQTLYVTGNALGRRALQLIREGVGQVGLGASAASLNIVDEVDDKNIAFLTSGSSDVTWAIGFPGAVVAPRQGIITGELGSGTNVVGGSVIVKAGYGTGAATPAEFSVYVPAARATGTDVQSRNERFEISEPASPAANDTSVVGYFYDGAAWNRVRLTRGAADSGGLGFRAWVTPN